MSDDTPLLTFQMQVQRQLCSCTVCDVMLGETEIIKICTLFINQEKKHIQLPSLAGGYKYLNIYKTGPSLLLLKGCPKIALLQMLFYKFLIDTNQFVKTIHHALP